jgi:hypothetical protein
VTFVRYDGRVISFGVANGWQPPTEFSAREMSGNQQVRYQNPEFCDLQRSASDSDNLQTARHRLKYCRMLANGRRFLWLPVSRQTAFRIDQTAAML